MATFTPAWVDSSVTAGDENAFYVDTTSGNVTLTLPVSAEQADKPRVIKIVAGSNNCILQPVSGTINGQASFTMSTTTASVLCFFGPTETTLDLGNYTWYVLTNSRVVSVATGTGLTGGPITTTGTISLADTAVTPASYTYGNFTVDAQGRLTAASSSEKPNKTMQVLTNTAQTTATTTGTGMNIAWNGVYEDPDSLVTLSVDKKTITFNATGRYKVEAQVQLKISTQPLLTTLAWYSIVAEFSAAGAYPHATDAASSQGSGGQDEEHSVQLHTVRNLTAADTVTVIAWVYNPRAGSDYSLADEFGTSVTTKLIITKVG